MTDVDSDADALAETHALSAGSHDDSGHAPEKIGRFVIDGPIGAGAMGIVFAAHDVDLGRKVALKVMRQGPTASAEEQARLIREARALARLAHPNVVGIHETGTHDGQVFIAMEYVPGPTLEAWLAAGTRGWAEVLGAFVQAGRGLAAAHAAGLVHRDFKPANVILGDDGRARILDFGLVRALGGAVELSADSVQIPRMASVLERSLTRGGAIIGTPAYMAPEQIEGLRADARTDQFGFCVALYEGLYRKRPFAGDRWFELTASVLGGQVRPPPADTAVPAWIFEVLRRGLAVDPAARWPSMNILLDTLEHGAPTISEAPRPARGGPWMVIAVAAIVALLAVVLAGLGCTPKDPATSTGESTTEDPSTTALSTSSTLSSSSDPTTSTSTSDASGDGTTAAVGCDPANCISDICDFEACVCALLPAEHEYIDCGARAYFEPPELWNLAHDCVLAAIADQASFKLTLLSKGLDSKIGKAWVGVAGDGYQLRMMAYDSYGPVAAEDRACAAVVALPDCDVDAGTICLECEGPGEFAPLCEYMF